MKILKTLYIALLCLAFTGAASAQEIRIALRAHQGNSIALTQWQPTADYLSEKIPGYHFSMVPFTNISEMNQAISSGNFQFSFANPSSAIEYINRYNAKPLLTLVNKRQGKGYQHFGAVIFTHAERDDINKLDDLKGKTFIAVDEQAFGGWRVGWLELLKNNINPFKDFKSLKFAIGNQESVVHAVLNGKVDAGTVRTDMLERLSSQGKINLENIKIIGEKKKRHFPFLISTDLYPEWLFSTVGDVDNNLKEKVIATMLSISVKDNAAIKGRYIEWVTPLDYTPVENLLKELKVGPYNIATMGAVKRFTIQYGNYFLIVIIVISLLLLIILYVLRLNKKMLFAQKALRQEINLSKQLERQLFHSQRIESLGQLTGGIAHDFNNMLASIIGFTELAKSTEIIKKDKKITGYLNHALTASEKCAGLVKQMLIFSRTAVDNEKQEDISISKFVDEAYERLLPLIPDNCKLELKPLTDDCFIHINPVQIMQVVMNLYLNAKDSIDKEQGTITIVLKKHHFNGLGVICSSCHQSMNGDFVSISMQDDGCGIEEQVKEHLFDPFFSTKDVGKGSGMGLSIVHGIMHKHEAHVLLESKVNVGTKVKILFPIVMNNKNIKDKSVVIDVKDSIAKYNDKHILVVDDEIFLTIYLKDILQQNNFRVTAFNDSEKALEYFLEHVDDVDLVITDNIIPNLSGIELAEKIYSRSETTPVILCSGYIDEQDNKINASLNIKAYIEKPIKTDQLIKNIESIFL